MVVNKPQHLNSITRHLLNADIISMCKLNLNHYIAIETETSTISFWAFNRIIEFSHWKKWPVWCDDSVCIASRDIYFLSRVKCIVAMCVTYTLGVSEWISSIDWRMSILNDSLEFRRHLMRVYSIYKCDERFCIEKCYSNILNCRCSCLSDQDI